MLAIRAASPMLLEVDNAIQDDGTIPAARRGGRVVLGGLACVASSTFASRASSRPKSGEAALEIGSSLGIKMQERMFEAASDERDFSSQ